MRRFCFTVDVDRDVNEFSECSHTSVSIDRGQGNSPRFSSSERGLDMLTSLLDELSIPGTFFLEARTAASINVSYLSGDDVAAHGLDHEDITRMDEGSFREMMSESVRMIEENAGKSPSGFRAPYMRPAEDLISILPDFGIKYDSSFYTSHPAGVNSIPEVHVSDGKDIHGKKITGYLWPMHEGTRSPKDYLDLSASFDTFVVATHSWHIVESRRDGIMSEKHIENNIGNVRCLLESLLDAGFRAVSAKDLSLRTRKD